MLLKHYERNKTRRGPFTPPVLALHKVFYSVYTLIYHRMILFVYSYIERCGSSVRLAIQLETALPYLTYRTAPPPSQ